MLDFLAINMQGRRLDSTLFWVVLAYELATGSYVALHR
jgi:hypothetical protein